MDFPHQPFVNFLIPILKKRKKLGFVALTVFVLELNTMVNDKIRIIYFGSFFAYESFPHYRPTGDMVHKIEECSNWKAYALHFGIHAYNLSFY